jgi:hypothetical protein
VIAAAYIEDSRRHDTLVILDSDTLFLREPCEFILPPQIDVAVRPVDVKGASTGGPKDSFDTYLRNLCRSCGVDYDDIPWSESFVDRQRIKANYNAGLVVVRGGLGIMRRCADFFFGVHSTRTPATLRGQILPGRCGLGRTRSGQAVGI